MPKATYTLELELSYNTSTDITEDWHTPAPLVIERGLEPGERVAGVGRMALSLHNPDGRYTPGHVNVTDGFEVGIGTRLKANDGTATYTLFAGRIAVIQQGAGIALTEIVCMDGMAEVTRVDTGVFSLLFDVTPGDLVQRLVSRAYVPPGRLAYWRLSHPQAGALGQGTRLSDAGTGVDIDAGQSEFPWAGDTWPVVMPIRAALEEVCASEGGFFFVAADGTPTFDDRHVRPRQVTAAAALSSGLAGVDVARSQARVANTVRVITHPREVGASAVILWQAGHSILIKPGETRIITCRYADPDQTVAAVGAQSVVTPAAGTDFTATTKADGTGTDVTDYVRITVEAGAAAARLTLVSDWPDFPVYVHDLQLRGVPLRSFYPAVIEVDDWTSIFAYGQQVLGVDMPFQEIQEFLARRLEVHVANQRRCRPRVPASAKVVGDVSHIHGIGRRTGHQLQVLAQVHKEKEARRVIQVADLVGQRGNFLYIALGRCRGDHDRVPGKVDRLGAVEQRVIERQLLFGKGMVQKVADDREVGPMLCQPGGTA